MNSNKDSRQELILINCPVIRDVSDESKKLQAKKIYIRTLC